MKKEVPTGPTLQIPHMVYWALSETWSLFKKDERVGGIFCLADPLTGYPILTKVVGCVEQVKFPKYLRLCQEKAHRLACNPTHLSSWQSRDESAEKYGGAVRMKSFIFSFSGLPELGDEALMLATAAYHYYLLDHPEVLEEAEIIARMSENPYWNQMVLLINKSLE